MNAGKILWRPKFGRFSLNLAIFGRFWPVFAIQMLFGLFMQNDVVSKQYFLYGHTDHILFYVPGNFQEVICIFGIDITV